MGFKRVNVYDIHNHMLIVVVLENMVLEFTVYVNW